MLRSSSALLQLFLLSIMATKMLKNMADRPFQPTETWRDLKISIQFLAVNFKTFKMDFFIHCCTYSKECLKKKLHVHMIFY